MNLQKTKQWLEENKETDEVKKYLDSFKATDNVGLELFKEKIETDPEFKSFLDSLKDKHLTKGIETFKKNNLEKLINDEIKIRHPEKDEKDLALQDLQRKMEAMEQEKTHEKLRNVALKTATEKGLPSDLVDYFIENDEETTLGNLTKLEEVFNSKLEDTVKDRLKSNGYTPPKSNGEKTYIAEDMKDMTVEEINENWDQIKDQ